MIKIRESFEDYFYGDFDGKKHTLLVNPSTDEIKTLCKEEGEGPENWKDGIIFLRGLIVNKTKLYVWIGDATIHRNIMERLEVMHGDIIPIFLHLDSSFKANEVNMATSITHSKDWTPDLNKIGAEFGWKSEKVMDKMREVFEEAIKSAVKHIVSSSVVYMKKMEY